jgi:dsDNA-specific endonuclease/ATPase MutS2
VPVEESIDLHTFTPRDVVSVVEEYLEAAVRKRFREVRLIHGKGTGVQRAAVRALLARHPLVESYSDAPTEDGGWGATRVTLKPPQD